VNSAPPQGKGDPHVWTQINRPGDDVGDATLERLLVLPSAVLLLRRPFLRADGRLLELLPAERRGGTDVPDDPGGADELHADAVDAERGAGAHQHGAGDHPVVPGVDSGHVHEPAGPLGFACLRSQVSSAELRRK